MYRCFVENLGLRSVTAKLCPDQSQALEEVNNSQVLPHIFYEYCIPFLEQNRHQAPQRAPL